MMPYTYRADGLRHSKTANNLTTTHVWNGAHIVLERNGSGAVQNRFIRGGGGRLLRSDHHGWYLHNARGDVVQRVDNAGAVLHVYVYDAFGVEQDQDMRNTNPFRYAGEYYDWATGTIYLRFRCYNPKLGRFTQEDPYWGIHNMIFGSNSDPDNPVPNSGAIMQAANLYVYVMNNPVRFIDPLGLWGKDTHREITRAAMEKIASANPQLANFYLTHAAYINIGNVAVDGPDYAALNNWYSRETQGRHFNRAMPGGTDTRLVWGEHYLELAVSTWLSAESLYRSGAIDFNERYGLRVHALYLLGRGLHSIQDIEAHGNIGIGVKITAFHLWGADDPNRDWLNSLRRNSVPSAERVRYNTSINDSVNFLSRFYRQIGMI